MLAERCGHLPLALVRAAEHIVNHRQHSAATLAADLKPEPARLLRELAGTHLIRHRDERHATEFARQLDTEAELALTMRRLADRYAP